MIALKALRKNPLKSTLIFSSITIAVMAIFLISSISQGVIEMYSKMIKTDGDIIVTQKGISDTFFSNIDLGLRENINALPEVKSSYAMIVGASPIGHIPIAGIYGTTKEHFSNYHLISGSYPKEKEVILGQNLAKMVGNKSVLISSKEFRVSGVFSSDIGFEEGGVVMNIDDAGELFNRSASFFLVSCKNADTIDATVNKIAALSPEIEVKTTKNFIKEYNQFKIIQNSSLVISALAFAMGLMGIASVMSMIVNSRKEEFGIMRSLGLSRYFIIKNIFAESVIVSVLAYAAALGLSYAILSYLPHIEMLQGYVSGSISLSMAFWVFVSTLAMALLGSLVPAFIASKTDPILLINQGCA